MPPLAYGSPSWLPQSRPASAGVRRAQERHDPSASGNSSPLRITSFPASSSDQPLFNTVPLSRPGMPVADAEYDYLHLLSRRLAPDQKAYEQYSIPTTRPAPFAGELGFAPAQERVSGVEGSRRPSRHHRTGSAVVIASPRQVAVPLPVANARARADDNIAGGGPTVHSAFGPLTLPQSPAGKYSGIANLPNGMPGSSVDVQPAGGRALNVNGEYRNGMDDVDARSIAAALDHLGLDGTSSAKFGHRANASVSDANFDEPEIKGIRRIRNHAAAHGRSQSLSVGLPQSLNDALSGPAVTTAPDDAVLPTSQEYQANVGPAGFPARLGRPAYLTHRPRAISLGFVEPSLEPGGIHSGGETGAGTTALETRNQGPLTDQPSYHHLRHNRSASLTDEPFTGGVPYGVSRQHVSSTTADIVLRHNSEMYPYSGSDINDDEYLALHAEQQHLAAIAAMHQRQQQVAGLYQQQQLEADSFTPEMPTRSIWVCNLDPLLSVTELLKYFSPLGVIDSVRMVPENECAFITYSRIETAIRAHEEMQGALIGNSVVRIAFGVSEGLEQAAVAAAAAAAAAANSSATPVMQPSRALWIGNITAATSPTTLAAIFSPFGPIESCRILTHKSCGFVNFERTEDAVRARRLMQGQDISGQAIRVGFAKVPRANSPGRRRSPSRSPTRNRHSGDSNADFSGGLRQGGSPTRAGPQSAGQGVWSEMDRIAEFVSPWSVWGNIAEGDPEDGSDEEIIAAATRLLNDAVDFVEYGRADGSALSRAEPRLAAGVLNFAYVPTIPPIAEPKPHRKVDQYRLREIKKRLDFGHATAKDFESAFNECFDDCVELCSDYIGNTVIQKFAERCSPALKLKLVRRVAPHLAAIGVHKNGTWSVQKIIDCAKAEAEISEITVALSPYTPALLLDQFGNYVVQCCLRLGPTFNQFIFDAMYVKCWTVAQGRFGARAMRTCLESQYVTRKQKKLVAIAIVENALQLATNANGSILMTWLLDASQLPGRYIFTAPRFAGHLSTLCTHKLASLTIIKIVNQRQEPEARRLILRSLFGASLASDALLEEVLSDQSYGVGMLQKCLASQAMEDAEQVVIADRVRRAIARLRPQAQVGLTRLMEEVEAILNDPVKLANAKSADPACLEYLYRQNAE